jgi:hypothetical protein
MFSFLGTVDYRNPVGEKLTVDFGIGIGGFLIHSLATTNSVNRWVRDSTPWKEGDERKTVNKLHFTALTPGMEGSVRLAYKLGPSASLGLTGRVLVISKIKDTWEATDYYQTDWEPLEPKLVNMKQGYEYGGVGWGLGISISF